MTLSAMSFDSTLPCHPILSSATERNRVFYQNILSYISIYRFGSNGKKYTRNAFALDGFGDDGSGLVAWLAYGFTQLFHTVAIHNDSMPPKKKKKKN